MEGGRREGGREGGREREVKESRRIPEASLSHSLCKPQEWAWHVLLHDWPVPPPCQPGMETASVGRRWQTGWRVQSKRKRSTHAYMLACKLTDMIVSSGVRECHRIYSSSPAPPSSPLLPC